MQYLNAAIYNFLNGKSELTGSGGILAPNYDLEGTGSLTRANSIVDAILLNHALIPLYVTFQVSSVVGIGKSRLAQLFIRVYNESTTNSYTLIRAKEIINNLLSDAVITYTSEGDIVLHAQVTYISEQPVRYDEAYGQNFVDVEYQILLP